MSNPPITPDPNLNYQTPPPGNPQEMVKMPALFLMIGGAANILWVGYLVLTGVLGVAVSRGAGGMAFQGIYSLGMIVLNLAIMGVMIFGGLKMQKLQSYNLAMAGAIAGLVPCGCCCLVTLPAGIWALIILLKPEVKAAFTN